MIPYYIPSIAPTALVLFALGTFVTIITNRDTQDKMQAKLLLLNLARFVVILWLNHWCPTIRILLHY
jgi:hypothetical protein